MSVTKDEAMTARVFHFASACSERRVERWRRNGATKTWKTRPTEFRVPVKYGLYAYSYIDDLNADEFHTAANCPFEEHREI